MTVPVPEIDVRAQAAAAGLRRAVPAGAPQLSDLVRASRVRKVGRAAFSIAVLVGLAAVALATASVADPETVRLLTGAVLIVLVASTWVLCAHAGGHALFVPLPALILGVLWALTASGHPGGADWWLVAMSSAAAAVGVMVGTTALRQRLRSAWRPVETVLGASGVAVTALTPVGVVQVANETWTATSLSGPLPVGAPVHVVRVDGVRLDVWSESGTVPDQRMLDEKEQR